MIVQQLLISYIPTAFATFLEPFWVLLNRLLCILQPFDSLNGSRIPILSPVKLSYTSLPPQFIVQRAWKARHYLLTSVCIMTILANPLAIVLSSLLNIRTVSVAQDVLHHPLFSPLLKDTRYNYNVQGGPNFYEDHYYVELANFTKHTKLPPWVSPEYFFITVHSASMTVNASTYELPTTGFGIESQCYELGERTSTEDIFFEISHDGVYFNVSTTHTLEEGEHITCISNVSVPPPQSQAMEYSNNTAYPPPSSNYVSVQALEISSTMSPWNMGTATAAETAYCKSQFLLGWVHARFIQVDPGNAVLQMIDSDALLMTCQPTLRIADFLVNTSSDGRVLSYIQTTPFDTDVNQYFVPGMNAGTLLSTSGNNILYGNIPKWHFHSFTSDWLNYFIRTALDSSSLVDPRAVLPPFSEVAPVVQAINRSIFAILLGLNTNMFAPPAGTESVKGKMYSLQPRVFMDRTMFIIATTILTLNLLVAMFYYIQRPKKFLPRMPTSLASVIAYVAASHAVRELDLQKPDEKYKFGKFIGVDGKPHVGIEKEVLTVPLEVNQHLRLRPRRSENGPLVPPKDFKR